MISDGFPWNKYKWNFKFFCGIWIVKTLKHEKKINKSKESAKVDKEKVLWKNIKIRLKKWIQAELTNILIIVLENMILSWLYLEFWLFKNWSCVLKLKVEWISFPYQFIPMMMEITGIYTYINPKKEELWKYPSWWLI